MGTKTIAVIGAGPVGGILAAHLISAGHQVLLVDTWRERIDRIRAEGLKVTGREEMHVRPEHLLCSAGELDPYEPEFVFICTKACDLGNVLDGMSDRLKQSGAVFISFQNGIETESVLVPRIPRGRALRAVVNYAGVLAGLGEIRETFFEAPNYVGWLDERGAAPCKEIASLVTASGLETEATGDIKRLVWRKAVLNTCTMSVAAVTGMSIREMIDFPPTARLVDALLAESMAVAAAHGCDFGPEFAEGVKSFNRRAGSHRPSMLADIENGRRTENAFLMRRIAEEAERKGIPAPLHRTMAALIDALETRGRQLRRFRREDG
jgi:2-dehydropantoate 2-reductase